MNEDEILQKLEKKFEIMKSELKLNCTFEELNDIFFLKDYFLKEGFVSDKFSRAISRRIVDLYMSWAGYLHGIVMPNPSSMINMTEHNMFSDEEKEKILQLMNKILAFSSRNSLIGLNMDRKMESEFIDDSIKLWNDTVKPEMIKVMEKVNGSWVEKSKE